MGGARRGGGLARALLPNGVSSSVITKRTGVSQEDFQWPVCLIGRQNVGALSIARDAGQTHLGLVGSCNLSLVACSGERRPPWGYPGQRVLREENDHTWCPGKFSA